MNANRCENAESVLSIFLDASLKIYRKFDVLSFMVIRVTCHAFYVDLIKKNIANMPRIRFSCKFSTKDFFTKLNSLQS